jgi:hypothetical protein
MQVKSVYLCSQELASLFECLSTEYKHCYAVQAPYHLMTSFPSQVIQDEDKTIEEAGLLNAVIIQKTA